MGTKVYTLDGIQQLVLTGLATANHPDLFGRSDPDQHPISAITGLTAQILDFETRITANEALLVNHETRILALEALHPVAFDDLSDVDLTGAADNDLLYRAAGVWIDTAGVMQWDGSQLTLNDYTFPAADGSANQILVTDGLGVLTYEDQGLSGGLLSAEYRFSTSIVAADPGAGRFRFDTAAYSTVTEVFIDDLTDNGVDISNLLALVSKGDRLYFQVKAEANEFVVFDVIVDAVDNTGWFTIGVSAVESGVFFGNNDKCMMIWSIDGQTQPQMKWYEGMSTRGFVYSDFMEPIQGLQVDGLQALAGASGFLSVPTAAYDFTDHPGVWGLNTGVGSAGRIFLLSMFVGGFQVGVGGITRHGCWYQAPAVLSDAVDEYVLRSGFSSMGLPNTILQGITFEYQFDQNGGRWQGLCEDGIGETSVDTGVTVAASTYYLLEFEVNAAGTSVEYFIDGVSVGTVGANIPSGLGFEHFISEHIMKLAGTTNRASYVDAYYFYQEISR